MEKFEETKAFDSDTNESQRKKNSLREDPFLKFKCLKQLCLVGSWMSIAFSLEIVGPCIPDLKASHNFNYEEISRAMIGTSVGLIVAAIIGGILHERFYKYSDFFMSFGCFIGATGVTLLPWMPNMWSLAIAFFCCGFHCSFLNPGGNAMVMHLWGEKSGPPMYSLHFGFGLGGLVAPQIAKQFILATESEHEKTNVLQNINRTSIEANLSHYLLQTTTASMYNVNESIGIATYNPNLYKPFLIVGCVNFLFSVFYFLFFLYGYPKKFPVRKAASNLRSLCSPKSCASEGCMYGLFLLALLFFFYIHIVGGEHIYGKWIFSYAIETKLGFTSNQAANLQSLFWLCHMCGRFSGIVFSIFIPTTLVIVVDISAAIVVSSLLCVFGHSVSWVLWVLTACMGFLVSTLFPAGMLWSHLYLNVSSMTVMICMLGGSAGYMIYVYLGGYILEHYGAENMMFLELSYAVLCLVSYAGLTILVRCFSFRHNPTKSEKGIVINEESKGMLTSNDISK